MKQPELRILLVEDDEEDYLITRDLLRDIPEYPHTLDWIDGYDDALQEIKKCRHDLYLFDYHLGGRDGLELLGDTLAYGCSIPVIMLTGQGGRNVDLEAMRLGAYDYLIKGQITPSMIERSIRYALEHARSTQALRGMVKLSGALLTAVSSLNDRAVVITDPNAPDNPITFANPYYAEMTGYNMDELMGRNPRFLQGPDTDPAEVERMKKAIASASFYSGQAINYTKDGQSFTHRFTISPVKDNQGHVVHYISIGQRLS